MMVLYVVQRYGADIACGAEQHCRERAERLAVRGHTVEVATTCAHSYVDWANAYEPGVEVINGVTVNRFPVHPTRDFKLFSSLNTRMVTGRAVRPIGAQLDWMQMQGPVAGELPRWLRQQARRFDVVVCFTYLYWTTFVATDVLAGCVPLVLHPTAHDEPSLHLSLFDQVFRAPDAFALSTPEEREYLRTRFHIEPPGEVIGIGVDPPGPHVDAAPFRAQFGLGDAPYLLYVGRINDEKGADQLLDYFVAYKDRHPGDELRLVLLGGEAIIPIPERSDIVVTGFVGYDVRDAALAGALALAQPSYYESFSMVLTEAFAHGRPALVQGHCEVLRGHAERSGAAIPYGGFAEFECALEMLCEDRALADAMGAKGRAYVAQNYTWDVVMDRYEQLLERTAAVS
jgi:glycosyltransferase involved in cell wall biosynthesis